MIERTENLWFYRDKVKVGLEVYHRNRGKGKVKYFDKGEMLIDYEDGTNQYLFSFPNDVYVISDKKYGRLACDHSKKRYASVYIYKNWFNRVPDHLGQQDEEEFVCHIDYFRTGSNYWKKIFQLVRESGMLNADKIVNKIAKSRYHVRQPKTWHADYITSWAWDVIHKNVDDPCIDNFRLALFKKSKHRKKYYKIKENGCCGSFDTKKVGPDGRDYLVGCNYGH